MALYDPVDGVYRKVSKKYDPVEGVYRKVKAAYDPVGGVYRQYFSSRLTAGGLAVGDSIWLNVDGTLTEFLVVHQGNPDPAMYDASCDGTWLLSKNVLASKTWDEDEGDPDDERNWRPADNYYGESSMHYWLYYEFINSIDSNVQSQIKRVKIPYWNSTGNTGSLASGANGLSTKTFLLSAYEVGFTTSIDSGIRPEGACLDYFKGTATTDTRRIAHYNGTAKAWWLRSPVTYSGTSVSVVEENGSWKKYNCKNSCGSRPSFILDSNTPIAQSDGKNIIE